MKLLASRQSQRGFTIVELLIVIVVIAILATITIVAYSGVQQRAQYARQVAALDNIGQAIKLWEADNGTLGASGAGWNGQGFGTFVSTGNYPTTNPGYAPTSVQALLTNAGYFESAKHDTKAFSLGYVLLAPCTVVTDPHWVVLTTVTPAPQESVANQIADTGCTNSLITTYTGSNYNRNLLKVY